jgi:hypothetical protein
MWASFGSPRPPRLLGNSRKKCREPAAERRAVQDSAHEIGLRKTGREKILARRFVIQRAVAVLEIKPVRGIREHAAHLGVAGYCGPIPYQAERESRLIVFADADGIVQLRHPALQAQSGLGLERPQGTRPLLCFGIVPPAQLRGQLQQPCKAIGPLERRPARTLEIGEFAGNVLRGQAPRDRRPHLGGQGRVRK